MDVIAYTKTPNTYSADHPKIAFVDKRTIFEKSDILSLHCPLTKDTHNFVDIAHLHYMKNNAIIINTCRGKCINE